MNPNSLSDLRTSLHQTIEKWRNYPREVEQEQTPGFYRGLRHCADDLQATLDARLSALADDLLERFRVTAEMATLSAGPLTTWEHRAGVWCDAFHEVWEAVDAEAKTRQRDPGSVGAVAHSERATGGTPSRAGEGTHPTALDEANQPIVDALLSAPAEPIRAHIEGCRKAFSVPVDLCECGGRDVLRGTALPAPVEEPPARGDRAMAEGARDAIFQRARVAETLTEAMVNVIAETIALARRTAPARGAFTHDEWMRLARIVGEAAQEAAASEDADLNREAPMLFDLSKRAQRAAKPAPAARSAGAETLGNSEEPKER